MVALLELLKCIELGKCVPLRCEHLKAIDERPLQGIGLAQTHDCHKAESVRDCEWTLRNNLSVINHLGLVCRQSTMDEPLNVVILITVKLVVALGNCVGVAVELFDCPNR